MSPLINFVRRELLYYYNYNNTKSLITFILKELIDN